MNLIVQPIHSGLDLQDQDSIMQKTILELIHMNSLEIASDTQLQTTKPKLQLCLQERKT